jgi:hypothetical protein
MTCARLGAAECSPVATGNDPIVVAMFGLFVKFEEECDWWGTDAIPRVDV